MPDVPFDDSPAFALTVYGIMDRYRAGVIEHRTACRALSAITLALAPDNLLDGEGEDRLGVFLGERLDRYRGGAHPERAKADVVHVIQAGAEANWDVLGRYGLGR